MVLSITIILLVVSQFNNQFTLLGFKTKKVEPFADILLKGVVKKFPMTYPVITDSIIARDSTAFASRQTDSSNIFDFENDSSSALSHFFESLNTLKTKKHKTRIAYFGDSMIEGDLISQDLRECMQDLFGGNGVGYLPVTSIVSGFRTSVMHSFDGWTTHNLLENIPSNHALGIAGYCFVPNTINIADTTNQVGVLPVRPRYQPNTNAVARCTSLRLTPTDAATVRTPRRVM